MKTTGCNEATFPSSVHRDSPPSLPSLGAHAQASSPSPPFEQQLSSFAPPLCAPFLQPPPSVPSHTSLETDHASPSVRHESLCEPARSQCRSTAQNHRAVEGSAAQTIVTKQITNEKLEMIT